MDYLWEQVFEALCKKHDSNKSVDSPMTWLYPQQPDCAVLYSPHSKSFRQHPLHLNPGAESWRPAVYKAILPAIELVRLESRGPDAQDRRFQCWMVKDWGRFAEALGLEITAQAG